MKNIAPSILTLFVAIITLIIMSLLPWSDWTAGYFKNFNLISDLLPPRIDLTHADDYVDPELKKYMMEESVEDNTVEKKSISSDSIAVIAPAVKTPRINGSIMVEDYSPDGKGLGRLKNTLSLASYRRVRIAMLGDSYIEGDIFAQNIRESLQNRYGGKGVGYVAAFTNFPGFRQSVNQSSSDWDEHEIRKMNDDSLRTILGTYFTARQGASTSFTKSSKLANLDNWDRTSVVFSAKNNGTITLSGNGIESKTYDIESSDELQFITVEGNTDYIRFSTTVPDLNVLGFWLEGNNGIVLDDISLRGNSGISHINLNAATTARMRELIDYDLIILEFGLNALSAAQSNYNSYGNAMTKVVENLKSLYPNAQILIMGVGDRGFKNGTDLISIPTINSLIKTQREVASRTGSLFWNIRDAMGGEGAAIDWHERKLVNADYIHLNHKGGKVLADLFIKSLYNSMP